MAQEIVGVKIQVEGNAGESVGSLKKQLREAQADVQMLSDKFGASSEQAVKAAKKAAELRDRIGDAKALTDAFNPDRKFQAFASALSGVVGGFSAVQGALGLVGVKSEEVEQTLLKVQSAMALSQGLNTVLESVDAFKNLGTVIQSTALYQKANNAATSVAIGLQRAFGVATVQTATGFKILKGAIAATGIGLLVVGLTALISKISDWTSSTEDNKAAQDRLNKSLEAQEKLFSQQQESLQRQREISVKRAQLANASADEIFKINQEFNKKDRAAAVDNYNKVLSDVKAFEKERLKVTKDGKLAGSEEDIKAYNEAKKQLESANKEIRDIDYKNQQDQLDNQIKINEGKKKSNEESAQKRKQLAEEEKKKQEQEAQERLDAQKKADEDIRLAKQENFLNSIKDEDERAKKRVEIDLENRNREIEALNIDESRKRQLKTQAFIDAQYQLDAIDTEIKAKQKQKDDQFAAEQKAALDKSVQDAKEAAEAKMKLAEQEANFKKQQLTETADALGKLGEIVGKETAAGKALAIAQALINTYQGATEALKQKSTLPSPFDFAAKAINVAAIIASGLKAVKAITAVKVPGGGGGVSAPTYSITGGGAPPISPAAPQAQLTQLDQRSINQLGSATNRSYVVESDITNSQERIRRINRAARLN